MARFHAVLVSLAVVVAALAATSLAAPTPAPPTTNPIIEGDSLFELVNSTANGKLFRINHPLFATAMPTVHLWGSPAQRGRAYGQVRRKMGGGRC